LYFQAGDGLVGSELWKSDGSASATVMVKDINSGAGSSSPAYLTAVGSTLYFQAGDASKGFELWKSDGSAETTAMVKQVGLGSNKPINNGSAPLANMAAIGLTLYFQDYYELQVPSTTAGQYISHSGWYLSAYSTAALLTQVGDWKAAGFTAEQSVEMANMSAAGDEFDLLTALIESSMEEEEEVVVVKKKVTVKAKVTKSPAPVVSETPAPVVSETPAPVESQAAAAEPEGSSGINPILIVLVVVLMSGLGLAYFFARRQEMQGNIFR
jgi:ELWxxDGT repeat protein